MDRKHGSESNDQLNLVFPPQERLSVGDEDVRARELNAQGDVPAEDFFQPLPGEAVELPSKVRVIRVVQGVGALAADFLKTTGPGQFVEFAQQEESLNTRAVLAAQAAQEKFKNDLALRQFGRVGRVMRRLIGPAAAALAGENARERYLRQNRPRF